MSRCSGIVAGWLLLLTGLLCGSCTNDGGGRRGAGESRTVLVYLAGDNNLFDLAGRVEQLRAGWADRRDHCLIYYDNPSGKAQLLELHEGGKSGARVETVSEYGQENSASAEVFGRVVREVVRGYPADSYGLIFASHASGWLPAGTLSFPRSPGPAGRATSRSIGLDQHPGGAVPGGAEMELPAFAAALEDHQFRFIIFESCLMAGVEVAYALRAKTDYVVASSAEMLVPGYAPIYPASLKYLFDTGPDTGSALTKFAGSYFALVDAQHDWQRSATQSVIRTAPLEALATRVRKVFSDPGRKPDAEALPGLQHFDRPGSYGEQVIGPRYFDFGQYLERIATPAQWAEIEALLEQAVVWKAATPMFLEGLIYNGFAIGHHSGLTTYVEQTLFPELNDAYHRTAWWRATHEAGERTGQ